MVAETKAKKNTKARKIRVKKKKLEFRFNGKRDESMSKDQPDGFWVPISEFGMDVVALEEEQVSHALGCKIEYDPKKYPALVLEAMSQGACFDEICLELKISPSTLGNWIDKYETFRCAVIEGESLARAWWLRIGRKNLDNTNFNAVLYMMNMTNRYGWTRKVQGKMEGQVQHSHLHAVAKDGPELDLTAIGREAVFRVMAEAGAMELLNEGAEDEGEVEVDPYEVEDFEEVVEDPLSEAV